MTATTLTLNERYANLKKENPRLRIRDAAELLDVSELELLELGLGNDVVRLEADPIDFLKEIKSLGRVMALTRNEYAVHERKGIYDNVSYVERGNIGLLVNPDIDLRLFLKHWKYFYSAAVASGPSRVLNSFQIFDAQGNAVHKIYLLEDSDKDAYMDIISKFKAKDQETSTIVNTALPQEKREMPLENIDIQAFQEDWRQLKDTHDFYMLLAKHRVARLQAMRIAPENHTRQLKNDAVVKMLQLASERQVPIMVFVGNYGCIQIHTGEVQNVVPMEGWINVMDPDFNLHLKLDGIYEIWETKKPTVDGMVTGIEVFDKEGELIVYCFGKRKPGIPEMEEWRELVKELE